MPRHARFVALRISINSHADAIEGLVVPIGSKAEGHLAGVDRDIRRRQGVNLVL